MSDSKELTPRRKLAVACVNYLLNNNHITLTTGPSPLADKEERGSIIAPILGKDTQITWHSISHGELSVDVWWGWRPCATNSATERNYLVETHVWLERKTACYLQGSGEDYLAKRYTARGALDQLRAVPSPQPAGYAAEGKFWR